MFKFLYAAVSAAAILVMGLMLLPIIIFEACAALWRRVELSAVHGGDEAARDKARWKGEA